MASRHPEGTQRATNDASANLTDWAEQPKPERDLKKAFLVAGLAILSWVATYVGLLELIEANMGELPILHKIIIAGSVAMLMTMIVWLLDQLFQPIGAFTKFCYAAGYLFLTLISVGFGFGFYWKVLESKGEGTRVAETAVSQVQAPLQTAATRLEGLGKTLDSLQTISAQKAEIERTQGTSCPNSRPGDGPRRKLRDDDASRFAFARDVVKGRIDSVKADIAGIDTELTKIAKNDPSIVDKQGTRNEFMKNLNRRLDQTVTNFNAFKGDPQLKQIRTELDQRAVTKSFLDSAGKPFACPDPGLETMIRSVVASIDALPLLDRPKIATVEGSDATVEAFRRLTATFFGALSFKLPPSADEMRDQQKKTIAQAEAGQDKRAAAATAEPTGLSKRDYIPLAIAIFVDICLLLVSMGRPSNRLGNLVPKMQAAERGPVIQILSRFNEIHHDRQVRENFEIFRHVVFDMNGDYYVAVPLDAPPRMNPKDREDLRLEAQLLSNLFTSFEKEKIFSRVLMPYISTKQIQKKLWKQGSKFAHSETFRLYKFKDGAWSEIILGAIMGAAKRVEAEKRRRRVEEDIFTRHEPSFNPGIGQDSTQHASAQPIAVSQRPAFDPRTRAVQQSQTAQHAMPDTGAGYRPSPPAFAGRPSAQPYAPPSNIAQYPGPAARRPVDPEPTEPADIIADLSAHRQRVEAQSDVSMRVANNNTTPVPSDAIPMPAPRPQPVNSTIKVEAVERTVTFHVPAGETTMPASLQALLNTATPAPTALLAAPDTNETFEPWTSIQDDDATTQIAGRFAPLTIRS